MSTTEEYVTSNHSNNGHIQNVQSVSQINQSAVCPESTLHFLNLTSSASPIYATVATTNNDESTAMIGAYQSNYTFSTNLDANIDTSSTDYMSNSNSITTNSNNTMSHLNPINSPSTNSHQRRGSLQLWQFLVALLDEPASR